MASEIILVRHGETEWSRSGRHTSVTDLELTPAGEASGTPLRRFFEDIEIDHVLCSPRRRARGTAELALGEQGRNATVTNDLAEWSYGDYEGMTTDAILGLDPNWDMWTQGYPGGEKPSDIEARLMRLTDRIDNLSGTVACFAHGHILRAFGALWVSGDITLGARLRLGTASVCILTYEHGRPAFDRWNVEVSR